MIRLKRPDLDEVLPDEAHRAHLRSRQTDAATLQPGDKLIKSRWDSFTQGKGRDRSVGPAVVAATRAMSHEKCAYCESVRPATVEHFWPKSKYPAKMFDWPNLLPSCRDCNAHKETDFPVTHGAPVLLHPVDDEPLAHLRWDGTTGRCLLRPNDTRASETARVLDLDRLATERLHTWRRVRVLLAAATCAPVVPRVVASLRDELLPGRPYLCVVRSLLLYPPDHGHQILVKAAVRALPAIVAWVEPWLRPPAGVRWPP